jgi:hypothetical protein
MRYLDVIRGSVASLVDDIETASHANRQRSWLERHPVVFAIGALGVELFGWQLIERERKRRAISEPVHARCSPAASRASS